MVKLEIKHIMVSFNQRSSSWKNWLDTYLTKERLHGSPVLQTWQPVQSPHEGLTEVPWAGSVAPAHHVNSVSVRRRRLPHQVAVHGAPRRVSQVVVPPVVPLLLVRRLLHPQ